MQSGAEFAAKDYTDPPPAPLIDAAELGSWSLYRAVIAEFIATLLFLYITVATVIGYKHQSDTTVNGADAACGGVGILGIAWAFAELVWVGAEGMTLQVAVLDRRAAIAFVRE